MRDYHPIRQTTSLKSHVHESSLEWDIDHFMGKKKSPTLFEIFLLSINF